MAHSTRPWTNLAAITTNAGSATLLLAGGTAKQALLIENEDASVSARVRFDGQDATATTGILVLAGKAIFFGPDGVPTGKISAFTASEISMSVAYVG